MERQGVLIVTLRKKDSSGSQDTGTPSRMLLQQLMVKHGFRPLASEWWHFTLENEPYPDTYFTFPVRSAFVQAHR